MVLVMLIVMIDDNIHIYNQEMKFQLSLLIILC
jgi:hypothetical protein